MPVTESDAPQPRPRPLSMRELLASCAAASAVSTPPRAPEPKTEPAPGQDRRAA
ncbi:hypothetical protein [Streptomyces sp. NPDC000983]|uniref:hypothetical protein n=1 Tax=Streptomyces sp. NPDC000983 TaxID=3154373 RepID=UPI00331A2C3F